MITQDPKSWQAGYDAGLAGTRCVCPPGLDGLSFVSGFIEGRAARKEGAK